MSLTGTLDATVGSDAVTFTFSVENEGSEPVEANFSDAQRADCVVTDDGDEVWRWSDGQMFAMMLGSETYAPRTTETYEMTWEEPPDGEFEAHAELAANGVTCEASTTVSV